MMSKRRWCCGTFPSAAHDPDCEHAKMLARVAPHLLSAAELRAYLTWEASVADREATDAGTPLATLIAAVQAFIHDRGRHDGLCQPADYIVCARCERSYMDAETRLDHALAAALRSEVKS
jgi:hypothetical protein